MVCTPPGTAVRGVASLWTSLTWALCNNTKKWLFLRLHACQIVCRFLPGRNLGCCYQTMNIATRRRAALTKIAVVNSICATNRPACASTVGTDTLADIRPSVASDTRPVSVLATKLMEFVSGPDWNVFCHLSCLNSRDTNEIHFQNKSFVNFCLFFSESLQTIYIARKKEEQRTEIKSLLFIS